MVIAASKASMMLYFSIRRSESELSMLLLKVLPMMAMRRFTMPG
jgi:hypothetical protein